MIGQFTIYGLIKSRIELLNFSIFLFGEYQNPEGIKFE